MRDDTISLAGLGTDASIAVDRWGIPHITASSRADLFFAQGFNAARDRLWQIDLWRKRGLGELAADFGPGYLEQDRASRLFLYRGAMAAEWDAYGGDAEAVCRSFTAGINAYVELTECEPQRLPAEFGVLGTRPSRWRPEDVVRIRSHALSRNALSEVARAVIEARSEPGADSLRQALNPAPPAMPAPELDPASIPLDVLYLYKLAVADVTFSRERLDAPLGEAGRWRRVSAAGEVERAALAEGSNNWVVHGGRTATGRPILANDPHRRHAVPSLRYLVHLTAPGLDVIGAGEPVLPGVSIGHNGRIAFGLTIFPGPDQEDVYVYETKEGEPDLYLYQGGWEPMRVVTERVAVRGHEPQDVTLRFTQHGPVVFEDEARGRAYAIRTIWSEPGSAPYFASVASMEATDFEGFKRAMRRWSVPTTNQVYADTDGNIAWLAAGRSPRRRNWTGLLPVPGDGRYEWEGFLNAPDLPWSLNPESGFLCTANEMNLPPGWAEPVGYEWTEGSRARRLHQALDEDGAHTVDKARALQADVVSWPAQRLCGLLRGESSGHALLRGWDGRLDPGSAAAALFEVWWTRHLRPAVLSAAIADPAARALAAPGDPDAILGVVERLDEASRDALLASTLGEALKDCASLLGEDAAVWSWGRLHQALLAHPLSALQGDGAWDAGPFPLGGSSSTPLNATYRPDDFRVTNGASLRVVIDVGDWDRSVCINAPGQGGEPGTSHYADLAPLWAEGAAVPLLYSAAAVADAVERRILLRPDEGRATVAHSSRETRA